MDLFRRLTIINDTISLLFWLSLSVFIGTIGVAYYTSLKMNQGCIGHLSLASSANTIELAEKELTTAIDYLETHGDTIGYTSIIFKVPEDNVGFFYHNLLATQNELRSMPADATQTDKTNTLLKLRETLSNYPPGLEKFPYNLAIWLVGWISFTLCVVLGFIKYVIG